MLRFTLATAIIATGFALCAPSAALAEDQQLKGMCSLAGGTMQGDVCVLQDGRTVTCSGTDDDRECTIHDAPLTVRSFGKLVNVPKLLFKKPVQPGPVEIDKGSKIKLVAPRRSLFDAVDAPSEKSVKRLDTPSMAIEAPAEKTVRHFDAPVMKMETIKLAPTVTFKALN